MEGLALLLLAVALYGHSWDLLGVTRSRSTGVLTGVISVVLILAALFSPGGLSAEGAKATAITALAILWALYAFLVAGLGLGELEQRPLGLYGLPLAVGSVVLGLRVWGASADASARLLSAGAVVAAVPFILLFIYAGLNAPRLERTYGYIQLIAAAVIAALAGTAYFLVPG
jgi:hypothetical protein